MGHKLSHARECEHPVNTEAAADARLCRIARSAITGSSAFADDDSGASNSIHLRVLKKSRNNVAASLSPTAE
jgi:hypothetical protein